MTENPSQSNPPASARSVKVRAQDATVCCRGNHDALGHPAVYLTFSDRDVVKCYYCGREFKRTCSE